MHIHIHMTEAARDYVSKMIAKENGIGFRLSIKKTGCSGFSYLPKVVKEVNNEDLVLRVADNFSIYVDTAWLELLNGVEIDFQEDGSTGLKQKKLVFTNPNESNRCGCGESFHIEG